VLIRPTVHNNKTLALLSFSGLRSHNRGAIYRAGNNMEANIMNDNVIAFPRTPADVADAERAAGLAAIETALADTHTYITTRQR
jgi:hypothetical protein